MSTSRPLTAKSPLSLTHTKTLCSETRPLPFPPMKFTDSFYLIAYFPSIFFHADYLMHCENSVLLIPIFKDNGDMIDLPVVPSYLYCMACITVIYTFFLIYFSSEFHHKSFISQPETILFHRPKMCLKLLVLACFTPIIGI